MDQAEHDRRIERRKRVVALIRAMHANDSKADELVAGLAADEDHTRVVGALAVAGSTLVDNLAKASGKSPDEIFDELEKGLTSAPVE